MTIELQSGETTKAKPKKRATKRRGRGEDGIRDLRRRPLRSVDRCGQQCRRKTRGRSVYGKTAKEVQSKLAKLQGLKADGLLLAPSKLTVAQLMSRWLEDVVRLSRKPLTYASYRNIVENHINKRIGGLAVDKLGPVTIQTMYSDMERAGASPRMRQYVHAVLHRALKQAVKWGLVAVNVCDRVDRPTVPECEMKVFTPEQAKAFMVVGEADRLHALYVLAITTGLRQGELCGLKWDDVDLESGYLSVRRNLVALGKAFIDGEPKTKKGKRRVDLPAIAVEALCDHRKRMLAEGNSAATYIFCDANGGPLRRQNVLRRSFRPILTGRQSADDPISRPAAHGGNVALFVGHSREGRARAARAFESRDHARHLQPCPAVDAEAGA